MLWSRIIKLSDSRPTAPALPEITTPLWIGQAYEFGRYLGSPYF
jgi:hypothetical protein